MIYLDEIQRLVSNRRELYTSIEDLVILGYDSVEVSEFLSTAINIAINEPSIKVNGMLIDKLDINNCIENGRFKLPFDIFSLVGEDTTGVIVHVISRVEDNLLEDSTDGMIIASMYSERRGVGLKEVFTLSPPLLIGIKNNKLYIQTIALQKNFDFSKLDSKDHHAFIKEKYGLEETKPYRELLKDFIRNTSSTIMHSLAYVNSTTEYNFKAATTTKITPMQVSKSKKPLWEYHLIQIKDTKRSESNKGGTHSPHRFHKVRGFHREYKHDRYINMKGKRQWIDPFERGDPSLGVIESDYVTTGINRG